MAKRRKKLGRPATGQDPVVPIRLPEKLLRDIDAWAKVYRDEHELVMSRSAAMRCLILLGMESVSYRAVDPKNKITFEGATLPLLKFYKRGDVRKWLDKGTDKAAKRKPPLVSKHTPRNALLSKAEIKAAADRAMKPRAKLDI